MNFQAVCPIPDNFIARIYVPQPGCARAAALSTGNQLGTEMSIGGRNSAHTASD